MRRNQRTVSPWVVVCVVLFSSCGADSSSDEPRSNTSTSSITSFKGSLTEALNLGLIEVNGQGLGTYRELEVGVTNRTNQELVIDFEAGTFFDNPKSRSQNLIALEDASFRVRQGTSQSIKVSSACTNAGWSVPGREGNWPVAEAPKGLDQALRFYGRHEDRIGRFLAKKNPEKLGTESQRKSFLQVAIWTYLGDNPEDVIDMLAQEVFHDDIRKARDFYNSVSADARDIADLMRSRDSEAIDAWIREQGSEVLDEGRKRLDEATENARDRLNRWRSN